jgi:hypothetical protein
MRCEHNLEVLDKNQICYYQMPFGHVIEWWDPTVQHYKGVNIRKELVSGFPESNAEVKASVIGDKATEPAVLTGSIITAVVGIGGLIQLFAPNILSDDTWELIYYLAAFFLPIFTAIRIRGKVWSPASVQEVLNKALEEANKTNKGKNG